VQIAAKHAEAVGKGSGMSVEEGLLLDGIALHSGGISPGNEEFSAAIEADFADSGLAFGDGAAMTAGETAYAIILEMLVESRIGFADSLVENVAQGGHGVPLDSF
jgi:hypothetical protein